MKFEIALIFLLIVAAAAAYDVLSKRIPNLITYPAMAAGLAFHFLSGGLQGLLFSLEGLGLGILLLIGFYLFSGMGAGDVKLLGAAGSFLGPQGVFLAFLFTALAGGIISVCFILYKGSFMTTAHNLSHMAKTLWYTRSLSLPAGLQKNGIPYGPAIAIGSAISILTKMEL